MLRTEPARGMRDFLPDDVRRREYVIGIIARVYQRYGFEPLETPAVENLETLLGKYGDEGNKLIYKILKRGEHEKSGEADLALRYDLTVPLARVVAHHHAKLPRLFKRYQIQPVWRADRPARGRFREFFQCDVDAVGSTSPIVESELCSAVSEALVELGFGDCVIRLNHRRILAGLLVACDVPPERHGDVLVAIDKYDKIGRHGVRDDLRQRGLSADATERLLDALYPGPPSEAPDPGRDNHATLNRLEQMLSADEGGLAAVRNLKAILDLSAAAGVATRVAVDPSLARGLSYYTGAIMEVNVADLAGSLGGGGRYDNLVGMFSNQGIPACGFSLGLERILVVMGERGMFPATLQAAPADVMVALFDEAAAGPSMQLASRLRAQGVRVLVYPDADKLGKQIKYADGRGIPFVALLGADEIAAGTVTVKNLAAQTQLTYEQSAAGAAILEAMTRRG
jgi:histidyl-tRNA synthetase